jgi:hypothetical protein
LYQTGDVLYGEGKLRDLGMVFKPSFKCLKNKKINLSPAFLKLETLLFQNMFLLFHLILYSQSDFDSKKKKKWFNRKKNMPYTKSPVLNNSFLKLFFYLIKKGMFFNLFLVFQS